MNNGFEEAYARLILKALRAPARTTRSATTSAVFGEQIKFAVGNSFPLLTGRRMYPKGVLGEFAAFVRKPKHVDDFKKWGCNYWDLWADKAGNLDIDYGNAWFENGQIEHLKHCLVHNQNDRRMIVSGWRPERLAELSLPCCHYSYQFFVANDSLHMVWVQRSVDLMIGLPSDFVLAALWLITLANEFGLKPGVVTMQLGDCHVYEPHRVEAARYAKYVTTRVLPPKPDYHLTSPQGLAFEAFEPKHLLIGNYEADLKLDLELLA